MVIAQGHRSLVVLSKLTSTVTTKNQILAKVVSGGGAGNVIPATSATVRSEIEGICNQSIASSEALTQVPAIQIFENDVWMADTLNNTNVAHNFQRMILSDSLTVNNTGTDNANGVVEQIGVVGAAADKKALFKFV